MILAVQYNTKTHRNMIMGFPMSNLSFAGKSGAIQVRKLTGTAYTN
jgi:hypothetical protein